MLMSGGIEGGHYLWPCALIQLAIPCTLPCHKPFSTDRQTRKKRENPGGSFDHHIYRDPIGVPGGVPNDFKSRNQITAGFESVLFWWSTINKNVDQINYLFYIYKRLMHKSMHQATSYYNQQRIATYTQDTVKGIAEQLYATSRMMWENRLALDMILAEKEEYISGGTITKALQGLTTLANESAESPGIEDPFSDLAIVWRMEGNDSRSLILTAHLLAPYGSAHCSLALPRRQERLLPPSLRSPSMSPPEVATLWQRGGGAVGVSAFLSGRDGSALRACVRGGGRQRADWKKRS
ncbi:hypothetical protein QTO34_018958 [Cnephaeus nilssonii]|uniref:Uncharacterized protein n=1 Tax=Cnephaeus nilssonii TaxID=3371016 RepID=A0AA40HZS4_CNENI|nr:hypothetical protein QTO34_018958 [Eptesicus nilssonii]